MLFTFPSTGGFERKPYFFGFSKSLPKNPRNKKTRVYSWIAFCRKEKWHLKPNKTRVFSDSSLCPETSTTNSVQEFHLSIRLTYVLYFSGWKLDRCGGRNSRRRIMQSLTILQKRWVLYLRNVSSRAYNKMQHFVWQVSRTKGYVNSFIKAHSYHDRPYRLIKVF